LVDHCVVHRVTVSIGVNGERVVAAELLIGRCGAITGALGGLGQEMCSTFTAAGARVALLDLDEEKTCIRASEFGHGSMGCGVDITDARSVTDVFARVAREFGKLDFLVNNAGVRFEVPFLKHDVERWRRTLEVNLTGTFLCAQAAARIMVKSGGGKIVNIASIAGRSAFRTRPAYVSSKAGIIGLTQAIAWELGSSGIYCNAIAPGFIETPLTAHYFEDHELAALIRSGTSLGRWGTPRDIVGPTAFLCSQLSDYIQGTTLFVDGGWLAGKGY
jgi:gluconate 5-dehydrogenase